MWGRGSYGGGGFGAYKALECIDPKNTSLSVAIFGQAWSWESEENEPDRTWERWWERDRLLWLGCPTPNQTQSHTITTFDRDQDKTQFVPGAYSTESQSIPLVSYFTSSPPPPPDVLPFYTTFSPGVCHAFFVEGKGHLESSKGWTDLDKQTSLGSLVWPTPILLIESTDPDHTSLIEAHSHLSRVSLCFDDAWLGGSSLNVTITCDPARIPDKDGVIRFFIPIEKLSLLPNIVYNYRIVWKSAETSMMKPFVRLPEGTSALPVTILELISLPNGWEALKSSLVIERLEDSTEEYMEVEIGIEVLSNVSGRSVNFVEESLHLGQISVSSESLKPPPRILSLDWIPADDDSTSMINGTLQWDVQSDNTSSWAYLLVFTHNDVGITPLHPILIGTTVGNVTEFDVVQVPRAEVAIGVVGADGDAMDTSTSHQNPSSFSQRVFFIRGVTLTGELSMDRHFSIV